MLKLTKTGIGLLTKQYRSVLRKCLLLNFIAFTSVSVTMFFDAKISCANTANELIVYQANNNVGINTKAGSNSAALRFYTTNNAKNINTIDIDSNGSSEGEGLIRFFDLSNVPRTYLSARNFKLNNSSVVADGITVSVLNGSNNLITSGGVYDALNYYYTFRVDERVEVIDSASFFQKDFPTLQEVDLQSKNPTHLGAFAKCDEVCPRPSERFASSLSQEQMLKNDASVDAGTSRHCLRQFGDVVADLLKNTAAKSLRIYEFMNEEVRHA